MGAQAGSGPCKLLVTNLNVQLGVRSSALFAEAIMSLVAIDVSAIDVLAYHPIARYTLLSGCGLSTCYA